MNAVFLWVWNLSLFVQPVQKVNLKLNSYYASFCIYRVSLDVLSVQGNTGPSWENKSSKAFWRGRDSRQERLDLVILSRKHPEVIDAALTHMFFFPKDPNKYGELVKTISFFDFFKVCIFNVKVSLLFIILFTWHMNIYLHC